MIITQIKTPRKSNENVQNFIKNYNSSAGGTCIFWTYHIINKVVENDTTVKEFIQSADWYESRSRTCCSRNRI